MFPAGARKVGVGWGRRGLSIQTAPVFTCVRRPTGHGAIPVVVVVVVVRGGNFSKMNHFIFLNHPVARGGGTPHSEIIVEDEPTCILIKELERGVPLHFEHFEIILCKEEACCNALGFMYLFSCFNEEGPPIQSKFHVPFPIPCRRSLNKVCSCLYYFHLS